MISQVSLSNLHTSFNLENCRNIFKNLVGVVITGKIPVTTFRPDSEEGIKAQIYIWNWPSFWDQAAG